MMDVLGNSDVDEASNDEVDNDDDNEFDAWKCCIQSNNAKNGAVTPNI